MSSHERAYALLIQANPIPDPWAVPPVPSPALLDERRSEMLTQEPTDVQQIAKKPRWPKGVVAFAATIVIVAAAVGIWAFTGDDGGPVAAGDAQIEVTFTGDDARYVGHREIIEGNADVTWVNESDAAAFFLLIRFDTGSAELAEELALLPEGDDVVSAEGPPGDVVYMDPVQPKGNFEGTMTRSVSFEPGTYVLDAAVDEADATHVYRAAVITVVAD